MSKKKKGGSDRYYDNINDQLLNYNVFTGKDGKNKDNTQASNTLTKEQKLFKGTLLQNRNASSA